MEILYPKYKCNFCHKKIFEEKEFFVTMKAEDFSYPEDVMLIKQGGIIGKGFAPGTQPRMHFCETCFKKLMEEENGKI